MWIWLIWGTFFCLWILILITVHAHLLSLFRWYCQKFMFVSVICSGSSISSQYGHWQTSVQHPALSQRSVSQKCRSEQLRGQTDNRGSDVLDRCVCARVWLWVWVSAGCTTPETSRWNHKIIQIISILIITNMHVLLLWSNFVMVSVLVASLVSIYNYHWSLWIVDPSAHSAGEDGMSWETREDPTAN